MCFLLVPSREDHNVGICAHILTELGKEVLINTHVQTDLREQLLSGIIIKQLCRQYFPFSLPGIRYANYLFFSTSNINDKLISFGILNNVFIITPIQVWVPDLQEASIRMVEKILNLLGSGIAPGGVVPTLFP